MEINSNISSMLATQQELAQNAVNISKIASALGDPGLQEVSSSLLEEITEQIPLQISYEANAGVISTQNAVQDILLNIKA
ncbi:MAG: hypothetical protein HRT41_07010 [Campylobacteraceae bacterium]|nr:hypothetical protein [Campylobacteraceae bacterium]